MPGMPALPWDLAPFCPLNAPTALVGIPLINPIRAALAGVLFMAVGLLVCYVPARHDSRFEPVAALKM